MSIINTTLHTKIIYYVLIIYVSIMIKIFISIK